MASAPRRFKDAVYEQHARVGKALSAPKRLELLDLLTQCPRTVEALAEQAALSIANTSQHLQVLRAAHLVSSEKRGLYVEYRLADAEVARFLLAFRAIAEARLAEIGELTRAYFQGREGLEGVAASELVRRVRSGEVTLLDVRPHEEYAAGHVAGALSIPVDELEARMKELPKGREIVAYCRGPYCVMAVDAVERLRAKGRVAHRLELGLVELRARGLRTKSLAGAAPTPSRRPAARRTSAER
jgi:rhodanese-related sulfurtransferase